MVMTPQKSLYEVLGVDKDSTQAEIKKAYLKLALRLHPDKNPGDAEAIDKFQSLQRIYAVLGDPDKRKVYDQTGSLEDSEELAGEQFETLYKFYRNMYTQISEEDIEKVEVEYRGSEEEARDVVKYYTLLKGNMEELFTCVMCSDPQSDSHRFMDIIAQAIEERRAKPYKAFKPWAEAVAKRPRHKAPLKPRPSKKIKKDKEDSEDLITAIRSKQGSDFARMAASLEARFSGRERGGRRREREPTEEEFAAAALKLKQQKQDSVKAAKEKAAKPSKTVVGKRKKAQRGIASSTKMQQLDS